MTYKKDSNTFLIDLEDLDKINDTINAKNTEATIIADTNIPEVQCNVNDYIFVSIPNFRYSVGRVHELNVVDGVVTIFEMNRINTPAITKSVKNDVYVFEENKDGNTNEILLDQVIMVVKPLTLEEALKATVSSQKKNSRIKSTYKYFTINCEYDDKITSLT